MKPNRGRKVSVTYKNNEGMTEQGEGIFQVWGYRIKKDPATNALHQESKAIVEMGDGNCRWVNPVNVKFLDGPNV